jgi:hypothetical protein
MANYLQHLIVETRLTIDKESIEKNQSGHAVRCDYTTALVILWWEFRTLCRKPSKIWTIFSHARVFWRITWLV